MQAAIAASLGQKTEGVSAVYSAALNAEEEDSQFKQAAEIMAAAAPLKENVIDISGNYQQAEKMTKQQELEAHQIIKNVKKQEAQNYEKSELFQKMKAEWEAM